MAVYHIGNASAASGTTTLTVTVGTGAAGPTYQAPGSGDLIWLVLGDSSSQSVVSVTDSQGQSYLSQVANGAGTQRTAVYALINAKTLVSGTDTFTITWAGTGGSKYAIVKGCDGISPGTADKSNGATGTSAAPSSGTTGALSQAAELVTGVILDANAGGTPTGFSFGTALTISVASSAFCSEFDELVNATTAQTASATITSAGWGACVATFKISAPSVTTNTVPGAVVGTAYTQQIAKTGGTSGFTWAETSGGLAGSGLSLGTGGSLHGTPTTAGVYNFTAQVTDGAGQTASKNLSVTVTGGGSLAVTTASLPSGTTGTVYASGSFTATGGTSPYKWSVSGGSLPPGLAFAGGAGGTRLAGVTMDDSGVANIEADYTWWNAHVYTSLYQKIYTQNVGSFAAPATLSQASDRIQAAVAKGNACILCYKPTANGTTNDPTWPGGANKPAQGNSSTPGTILGDLHLLIQSVQAYQAIGVNVAGICLYQEADGHKRGIPGDGLTDPVTQIPYLHYQYYPTLHSTFPSIPVVLIHVGYKQNTDSPSRSDYCPFPTQVTSPRQLAATAVGTGGTFAAGTYFWRIAATDGWGRVYASNEATATVVLNGSATLAWTNPGTGANASSNAATAAYTQIQVYRGTTAGSETTLVATLAANAVSYTDTGTAGTAQTLVPSVYADAIGVDLYGDAFDAQTTASIGRYVYSDNPNTSPGYADIADWNKLSFGWTESGNTVGGAPAQSTIINYLQGDPNSPSSTPSSLKNSIQAVYAARVAAGKPVFPYMWYENPTGNPPGQNAITSTSDYRIPLLQAIDAAIASGGTSAAISGTPTLAGNYTVTLQVKDSATPANTAVKTLTITITGATSPPAVTTTTLPPGQAGVPYTALLTSTGGTPPVTWTSGPLPDGVTLSTAGTLGGTPQAPGTYTITVTVTDSAGLSATATLTLTVTPAAAPPPVPFTPLPAVKPWRFIVAAPQPDGTYLAEITQAQTRSVTFRTGTVVASATGTSGSPAYSEATIDILGTDPAAAFITELQTDLQVLLGGQILFCGRFGATADQLDATQHRFQPTATDYREVLRRRSLAYGGGPNFTGNDVADIAWGLIQPNTGPDGVHTGVQGYPGGNLGIARGIGKSGLGTSQTVNYIRQSFAGIEIDNLAQLNPGGFDWDITPYAASDLRLDLWTPGRGADRGVVLEYGGGLVSSIQRTVDPSTFTDSVFVTGQSLSASTTVESNSNGGTISNIATWNSPSPGVLDVATVTGFGPYGGVPGGDPGGGLTVHCSGHTNALLTYTGTNAGTFTGCQYVSGSPSGTVSTGNSVTQTPLDPVQVDATDIATRAEGRWDAVIGTTYTNQGILTGAATYYLQTGEVVTPSYQVQLYPGTWQGPSQIWLGDTVTVRVKSGRLNVSDRLRVQEMAFTIGPDNVETLVLTIGLVPFRLHQQIPKMLRRLRNLEAE